jgi:hypothetical protein
LSSLSPTSLARALSLSPPPPTLIFHLRARFIRGLPTAWRDPVRVLGSLLVEACRRHDPKVNANA